MVYLAKFATVKAWRGVCVSDRKRQAVQDAKTTGRTLLLPFLAESPRSGIFVPLAEVFDPRAFCHEVRVPPHCHLPRASFL